MDTKYKVKLSNGRLLGPLDFERVQALARKGHFNGNEATSVAPFTEWRAFSTFPQLAALLSKKKAPTIATTKVDASDQQTATMVQSPNDLSLQLSQPAETELEMPTLLDIKIPPPATRPDDERTLVGQLYPVAEATKAIDASELQGLVKKAKQVRSTPPPAPAKVDQAKRKPLLSPKIAIFLAIGLVVIGFLSQFSDDGGPVEFNLSPKTVPFPFLSVGAPAQVAKTPNARGSLDLVEAGIPILERSTPRAIITSAKDYFYPAVQKNAKSVLARSLLATAYIRLAEVVPRDEYFFDAIKKLLTPAPTPANYIPEYVVARTEYLFLLQRFDQALEFIDEYLKRVQTPELLYQKARIHSERHEIDLALSTINRALKLRNETQANPRHRLLLAELLALKKADVAQEARALFTEHPKYGPGILFNARLSVLSNKHNQAIKLLSLILQDPLMVNRLELADAFLLTARALEGLKNIPRALLFAETAREIMPDKEEAENIIYRLRSRFEDSKKSYSFILKGRSFEREKVYDRAENQYILARETSSTSAVPLILWGRLLEKRGDPTQAIDRYKKALQLNPQSLESMLKLAELYIKRYDFESAKTILDRAATFKRSLDQIDYWRGYIYRKIGKAPLGETLYRKALSGSSRFAELYIAMGEIEAERKNRELAEFYYAMALRYDSVNPRALLGVALTRFHLESPSRSIAFLKDKLNSQPNSAAIMTNLAVIFRYSGDKDSTKNYLQNAMRSDPTYAEAFRQIGDLAREEAESYSDNFAAKENNYRFALASYEGYSKLAPNDPEGYMSTAELYYYVRDFGAAAKNYYKVLDLAPNYPGVRLRLARISLNGRDPNKAMQLVQDELRRYPESTDAQIELGKIYMQQALGFAHAGDRVQSEQKYNDAAKAFTSAARLDDGNATAIFFLGYVHLERGNYDSAQTLLERAKKMEPLSPDVHLQLGRVYLKRNYKAKAMAAFTDARGLTQEPEKLQQIDDAMRGK